MDIAVAEKPWDMLGGSPALDLVNTFGGVRSVDSDERIKKYTDFLEWSVDAEIITSEERSALLRGAKERPGEAASVYQRVLELREALFRIAEALIEARNPSPDDLRVLNHELRSAPRADSLTWKGSRFQSHTEYIARDLEQPLGRIAWTARDLFVSDSTQRIRLCGNATCGWVFLDTSKNRSRRWCDMKSCGNVQKARAFRNRKSNSADSVR